MHIKIQAGPRTSAQVVRLVVGRLPNVQVHVLADLPVGEEEREGAFTWERGDARALYHISRTVDTTSTVGTVVVQPLTFRAAELLDAPIPKGWAAFVMDAAQPEGWRKLQTFGEFARLKMAGEEAYLLSPEQRAAIAAKKEADMIRRWDEAGLAGRLIWEARLPYCKEEAVIQLASKLANRFLGVSADMADFKRRNNFRSPLPGGKTTTAEVMAAITCGVHVPDVPEIRVWHPSTYSDGSFGSLKERV